jgi:K+-transporting ATPase ATPase A chain
LNAPGLVVSIRLLANLVQMVMIFSIGAALINVFGRMVDNQRQGWALFGVMGLVGVIIAYSFKDSP